MTALKIETIRQLADSPLIFKRGEFLQRNGAFRRIPEQCSKERQVYEVDGNYGNYRTEVSLNGSLATHCSCPYPGRGCKHVVAILLDLLEQQDVAENKRAAAEVNKAEFLLPEEIRAQALEDRQKRALQETFQVIEGEMLKGDHLVMTTRGRQYQVTLHDPRAARGHCSCPDYHFNQLGTCKHLFFLSDFLLKKRDFNQRLDGEIFPYIDIFWDGRSGRPRLFQEMENGRTPPQLTVLLQEIFDEQGLFRGEDVADFIPYLSKLDDFKEVRVQEPVLRKLHIIETDRELQCAAAEAAVDFNTFLKVPPYPYQIDGMRFGLYKKAVLIGDEMGLGKTLQAIGLAIAKKEIFGFERILVVTLSSLKLQWQREIEHCSGEKGCIIAGSSKARREQYRRGQGLFKITNYEAVLRDVTIIGKFKPDLIILDEAQRIKNFETKTAEAVKSLPRQHAIILTGTPLENKLEDVYSLMQFLDPDLLSPLWRFAADHFLLNRRKKGDILGYVGLDSLHTKLKPLVIRRRKEEVLEQLPELIVNNYFVDLSQEQAEIHTGYSQVLMPLLSKKFLTPMDIRRIQTLLLKMRQVCDSTYLIDRETNISPKLAELATVMEEVVIANGRKVVIFSEWTSMTMLIGKQLSRAGIPFVELSGKVPIEKRQLLIDEFTNNPACKVFLSTDAGGTGLNLQAADCVVNFELPWNPAKVNQRIGRVNRLGQKSQCINVVNLIAKQSIEERIMAGIKLKEDLFSGVFDGGRDEVLFSREKRQEMLNRLREMIGAETEIMPPASLSPEELAEDTPHFLNPEVLNKEVDFIGEESLESPAELAGVTEPEEPGEKHSVEKMEEVLNQGMGFISGLLEMATGKKLGLAEGREKMVTLDKKTGEVTLKFTLPGF